MSRTLTASDRKTLIRLASELPPSSLDRRVILSTLAHTGAKTAEKMDTNVSLVSYVDKVRRDFAEVTAGVILRSAARGKGTVTSHNWNNLSEVYANVAAEDGTTVSITVAIPNDRVIEVEVSRLNDSGRPTDSDKFRFSHADTPSSIAADVSWYVKSLMSW